MRALAYLKKTFLENLREWKVLSLALIFAPAFVFMMYGYYCAATPSYRLLVANHDTQSASGAAGVESAALLRAWREARHTDGKPVFTIVEQSDLEAARVQVRARDADLLVEIPAGFTASIATASGKGASPARLTNHADERNLRSSMAMAMSDYVAFTQVATRTGVQLPLDIAVTSLGSGRPVSDFDLYVPALLVLAIIMILFTAATSLVKEVDKGTMIRLMLSRLKTPELLAAVSVNQVLLGIVALALAYLAALGCGYRSEGSLAALLVVGAATTLGVVAIAVLCSAFLKSMFELLTVGTFPFFILMFFSECMFPLPKIPVLAIGSHTFYANDILPPTLCVRAFNKILTFGAGLGDVGFELGGILVLTVGYFAVGTWLFSRRHQRG
ncbi:MAG TPA: ABC transporter permease [Anaeromyxobacteraceae bacterium]|nr:ABC transporter permease [Anaeromyxobacteraceae bacterium]